MGRVFMPSGKGNGWFWCWLLRDHKRPLWRRMDAADRYIEVYCSRCGKVFD